MAGTMRATFSITETSQYRRIVDFVFAVNAHAESTGDEALREMVAALRDDLLDMPIG